LAVGVPGVLDEVMRSAPQACRIIVVGVCMEPDTIWPIFGVTLQTLQFIAEGKIDVVPLITGEVGIASVFAYTLPEILPQRPCPCRGAFRPATPRAG